MLAFLEESKDKEFDTIFFLSGDKDDTIQVQFNMFKERGHKIGGSEMGDSYHIILFREDEKGNLIEPDMFEAILTCPLEYISSMIKQNWFGVIARMTTTSDEFVKRTFDMLTKK